MVTLGTASIKVHYYYYFIVIIYTRITYEHITAKDAFISKLLDAAENIGSRMVIKLVLTTLYYKAY